MVLNFSTGWPRPSSFPPPLLLCCSCPLAAFCPSLALVLALQHGLWNVRSARSARPWGACFGALASRCARSLARPILPQASQTFLGARQRAPGALGECAYLRTRAPARSGYLRPTRPGRARQVFGGHVTDALWNALAAQFEERCSGLVWQARSLIRV